MAPGPVKLKNINNVIANGVTATNILSFKEEHLMNFTPQFIPNTFQGLGVLEKAKWRQITVVVDSESNLFDASFSVTAANVPIVTAFTANFTWADALGTTETWTYEIADSYVQRREQGRIEDATGRNTIEYVILMFGTKDIA